MKHVLISAFTVLLILTGDTFATEISIGTGGKKGTYYAQGKILCKAVERFSALDCERVSTKGYRQNVIDLLNGKFDQIFIPSHGLHDEKPHPSMRYVLSLNPEAITVLVKPGHDIDSFANLKGSRIAVLGNRTNYYLKQLVLGLGWSKTQYSHWEILNYESPVDNFCNGKSIALVLISGHPSSHTEKTISKCGAKILNLDARNVRDFVDSKKLPYFSMVKIPDIYWLRFSVSTVGLPTTIVSRTQVPKEVISSFVKAMFENIQWLRKSHPSFTQLDRNEMSGDGRTLPYHLGAIEYYHSVGLRLDEKE